MPIIDNEQDIKRQSLFLDYEIGDGGNMLILKSKVYQIHKHYLDSVKRGVLCRGEGCLYCSANYQMSAEYNYMVFLNGQTGFMDIKASVFFAMQKVAKAQKRDMRQVSWTVIKTGEGLLTKYNVSKDDNLSDDDFAKSLEVLGENTDKLIASMERHEADLDKNYTQYLAEIRDQGKKKQSVSNEQALSVQGAQLPSEQEEVVVEQDPGPSNPSQDVLPEEIPF